MNHSINIDLSQVDWELLREQKISLLVASDHEEHILKNSHNAKMLCGLIELLDYIQDEAANQTSEGFIFGDLDELSE